nr:hypothetical protein CFP56_38855 [Quercus suber]
MCPALHLSSQRLAAMQCPVHLIVRGIGILEMEESGFCRSACCGGTITSEGKDAQHDAPVSSSHLCLLDHDVIELRKL